MAGAPRTGLALPPMLTGGLFKAQSERPVLRALSAQLRRHLEREWFGSPPPPWALSPPRPEGLAAHPHDPRPVDAEHGRKILSGAFALPGGVLRLGESGDPFHTPSPSPRSPVHPPPLAF